MLVSLLLLASCGWWQEPEKVIVGTGEIIKEDREVSDFEEIELRGVGTVILTQGKKEALMIEAPDYTVAQIVSEVDDEKLKIYPATNKQLKGPITYHVSVRELDEIKLHGTIQLNASSITGKELEIEANGACRVHATVQVKDLEIEGSGAVKFDMSGKATNQEVKLSGACSYNAGALQSDYVEIKASGSTRIMLNVSQEIEGKISGASIISYRGNPEVEVKTSGASSVNKVG